MHQVAGHLAWRGAAAEDLVHAQVVRRAGIEPRAAHHQQRPLQAERRMERRRHLAGVRQVRVALGHHLADQHRIGVLGRRPGHQVGHADLRPHVHHPDLPVVLQALLPRVPLDVEDRVDADRMRVGADAGADHDQLAAKRRADPQVHLGGGQHRELPFGHGNSRQIDNVADPAVHNEEGEVGPHPLGVHHHRGVQAHLARELQGSAFGPGPFGLIAERDRQRERHLHPAVPRGVTVRAHNSGQAHEVTSSICVAGL